MSYGIENWFDNLCDVWKAVKVGREQVRSYRLREIPESVNEVPCAISFLTDIQPSYSAGQSVHVVYSGKTEFHLSQNLIRSEMRKVLRYVDPIIAAAAGNLTLNGKVTDFRIREGTVKLVQLSWGNETEHFGIEVPWMVQECQSGKVVVSS